MLTRHQVLLEEWLVAHLKDISVKYDISFSEAIRIALCLQIPKLIEVAYPKCCTISADREMVKTIKAVNARELNVESKHKVISRIYYEARKAIELWTKEERKGLKT